MCFLLYPTSVSSVGDMKIFFAYNIKTSMLTE